MSSSFRRWLKSEVTVAAYRIAYLGSWRAFFPVPSSDSDILFVLGSGSSTDNLAAEHWDLISGHTSIGINFWTIHPFRPDYYALEKVKGSQIQSLETLLNDQNKTMGARVLWFDGPNQVNRSLLRDFRRRGGRVWFYSGWPLYKNRGEDLRKKFLHLFRAFQWFPRQFRPSIDAGNTVSRIVTMASMNGWKNIVLLGVDLGGSYFREYEIFRENIENVETRSRLQGVEQDGKHGVDGVKRGEFRLSVFLPRLDCWIREMEAGQIFDGTIRESGRLRLTNFKW